MPPPPRRPPTAHGVQQGAPGAGDAERGAQQRRPQHRQRQALAAAEASHRAGGDQDVAAPTARRHRGQGQATGVEGDAAPAEQEDTGAQLVRELAGSAAWTRSCGSFDVSVGKAALSHHFSVLRGAGLVEQRDQGPRRVNRLRREEFDARFPGLLDLVLGPDGAP